MFTEKQNTLKYPKNLDRKERVTLDFIYRFYRFKFLISDINKNIKIFLYYILKTYINRYF